jgi:fermentation-respiration switch protein FrsA (DUF1100 family)
LLLGFFSLHISPFATAGIFPDLDCYQTFGIKRYTLAPIKMRRLVAYPLVGLGVAFGVAVLWAGDFLTKPARSNTGAPPAELDARSLTFPSASGGRLSAWFIPGTSARGAVLLLHPIRSNKLAMLSRAQFLKRQGYSIFLVDLQAHGESEGDRITFGHREAKDVRAAVEKLNELAPGEKMGALGVSLGAVAIVLSDIQGSLAAVVLESPYATIEESLSNRLQIYFGAVGRLLAPFLLAQLEPRLGVSPSQLRPIERIQVLRSPLLVVHGTEDRHTTFEEAQKLYASAPQPKEFYAVQGAAHVDLYAFSPRAYEERVGRFLARYLRSAG